MKLSLPAAWVLLLAVGVTASSCNARLEVGTNHAAAAGGSNVGEPGALDLTGGTASSPGDPNNRVGGSAPIGGRGGSDGEGAAGEDTAVSGGAPAGEGYGGGVAGGGGGGLGVPAPLSLAAPVPYPGGAWAMDIAVADLNGDGALDVASADFQDVSAGAFVWLNHGDGTFDAAAPYLPGKHATSIAVGDWDGDAKADLMLATEVDLNLLRNEGAGTFSAPTQLPALASAVRALDANGDAKLDLLAGSSLYLNQGSGSFGEPVGVSVGTPRVAIDLNGDDRTDLVGGGVDLFVALNTGDGVFGPRTAYETGASAAGSTVRGPAVGDVDGDGWLDVAAANDRQATVSVILNQGDGTFSAARVYPAGAWPTSVALGDLNGDGWPELVVANSGIGTSVTEGPRYLGVYLNRGDGTFATPEELLLVEFAYSVVLADLDRDDRLDIVVGDGGGRLNVILNTAP